MTINNRHQAQPTLQQPVYDRAELHNQQPAVITPLAQAIISGALTGLFAMMIAWILDIRWSTIIQTGAITGITVALLVWGFLLIGWRRLTYQLEYFFGDLNKDNHIGPPPITYTVNTFNREGTMTGQRKHTFECGVTPEQIEAFCHKTRKMGFPISRRPWGETGIISEDLFRKFYGELVEQQLVTMRKGKNVLTEEGRQWADGVIAESDPHYSPSEDATE